MEVKFNFHQSKNMFMEEVNLLRSRTQKKNTNNMAVYPNEERPPAGREKMPMLTKVKLIHAHIYYDGYISCASEVEAH